MILLKLSATFGRLNGETLTFGPGLTLIDGANGSGKSTWCALLRVMLYGLDTRQRDRRGSPADKNRYRPWSGAPMEGLMVCEHQGQVIEIRRTSGSGVPMGDFSAVYAGSNRPVPGLTGENAGEVLTGVGREVFDRSVFFRHSNLAVGQSQELERRITALVSAGEEDVSFSRTDETLKTWQHRRRYHAGGLLPQLEAEELQLQTTLEQTLGTREELSALEIQARELREELTHWDAQLSAQTEHMETLSRQRSAQAATDLEAAQHRVQTLQAQQEDDPEPQEEDPEALQDLEYDIDDLRRSLRGRRRRQGILLALAILLTVGGIVVGLLPHLPQVSVTFPVFMEALPLWFFCIPGALFWLIFLVGAIGRAIFDRRDRRDLLDLEEILEQYETRQLQSRALDEALTQLEQAQKYYEAVNRPSGPYQSPEAESCREDLHEAEREIAQLQGQLGALGDPADLDARLDNLREEIARMREDCEALEIAREVLGQADQELHARFSPQLTQKAGAYFSRLSRGRYQEIALNRDLEVSVLERGSFTPRPLALLSQGTADQLYLALRLAVAELVLESPQASPLVLDDALLTLDDDHLEMTLELLLELAGERQIILFTCQGREAAFCERRGGAVRFVGL